MSNGGPWGGGGGGRDPEGRDQDGRDGNGRRPGGPRRPGDGAPIPEIEEFMKKGTEQLRVLMGGRGGGGGRPTGGGRPSGPAFSRGTFGLIALAAIGLWIFASFYTVRPEERSVELMFGEYYATGTPGLNFAPWPVVTAQVVPVTGERTTDIGTGRAGPGDSGLILTRDQNIVDIEFQVVWNVSDPQRFLFNLADPDGTIRAVAESAMRDIVARSNMAPILNRDRGVIATDLRMAVQGTLDSYDAGINIVRVNLGRADPPAEVIGAFREVQAAQQERDRLQNEADAYANRVLAGARGEAARIIEDAEAYRASAINGAQGEASRFVAIYDEYVNAPEVTRRRLYIETMERVLGGVNKVILDGVTGVDGNGTGVLPYLPLDGLRQGSGVTTTSGGTN